MSTDPRLLTFLKYLSGFTLAMIILVTANNLALVFMGWEGVGLFSYLLIGFWYTRTLALKASLKAVIVNWIGDAALLLASGLLLQYFGTLEFKWLQDLLLFLFTFKINFLTINFYFFNISLISLICFFLLIAAMGKSAQFGLHTWLPDAMEGPTPVSALIHAATMVTAGVYLIVWTSFLFEFSEIARNLTVIIGALTALFGSVTACFQFDIKRIIAFSTCSQLGYMFVACGLSAYNFAMFHLFVHAFFKALLFLCAGSVIHAIFDEQDIWKMGGLLNYLPITYLGLCIGFLSLAGLPFTSGFFSKDTIIELALAKWDVVGCYAYICVFLAAFFTSMYSIRFFYYVIFNDSAISWSVFVNIQETGKNMLNVIFILTIITIFIGGLTKNPLTSTFSFIFFSDSIFITSKNFYFNFYENLLKFYVLVNEYVLNYLKLLLFIIPFIAIYYSILVYWYVNLYRTFDKLDVETDELYVDEEQVFNFWEFSNLYLCLEDIYKFFENKSSFDQIYNQFLVKPLLNFSYQISYKELDRGWLEFMLIKIPSIGCFFLAKIFNQSFFSLKLNFLPNLFFLLFSLLSITYIFFN
jgi:proton-translocating NADH-quinone oxidoreductase chain L